MLPPSWRYANRDELRQSQNSFIHGGLFKTTRTNCELTCTIVLDGTGNLNRGADQSFMPIVLSLTGQIDLG
ncbi:MAG TPA: hypothetical protein VG122_25680, partial [Gemmata sp.]|nr:hypothetical protein [Gemmata sp.]